MVSFLTISLRAKFRNLGVNSPPFFNSFWLTNRHILNPHFELSWSPSSFLWVRLDLLECQIVATFCTVLIVVCLKPTNIIITIYSWHLSKTGCTVNSWSVVDRRALQPPWYSLISVLVEGLSHFSKILENTLWEVTRCFCDFRILVDMGSLPFFGNTLYQFVVYLRSIFVWPACLCTLQLPLLVRISGGMLSVLCLVLGFRWQYSPLLWTGDQLQGWGVHVSSKLPPLLLRRASSSFSS